MTQKWNRWITEVRACRLCEPALPLGARPVLQADPRAVILIAGQAPGRRVHETGVPFNDPSGDRLRDWLGLTREQFYDASKVALVPMGFCFPGTGKSGDLPPRPECAVTWRGPLMQRLTNVRLTLALGHYAVRYHFPETRRDKRLADSVARWRETWPERIAMPHPSPRNNRWLRNYPLFEAEVVPALRQRVAELLVL
jgi:uracil-DNA glycosylase